MRELHSAPPSSVQANTALAYAKVGMAVFPVRADKTPLTPHGCKDATRDPPSLAAWWRLYPFADIGWALPENVVVIDIDRKQGRDGYSDFLAIGGGAVDAFDTPQATTPTGGRHIFCRSDGSNCRNGVRLGGLSIDVRTHGGYVVLPSPGNGRHWVKPLSGPWMPAPGWTVAGAACAQSKDDRTKTDIPELTPTTPPPYRGDSPYGLAALRGVCIDIANAPDGSQETTLNGGCFKIGRLIGAGELSFNAVADVIAAALSMPSYRDPPWEAAQIEAKVKRAVDHGVCRPWTRTWLDDGW